MKHFNIFEEKFVWTRTRIINYTILIIFLGIASIALIFKIEKSTIFNFLLILCILFYLIGGFLKFKGINQNEQLKGKLNGKIIFEKENIVINDQKINLSDIKKIEIEGVDWLDLRKTNYSMGFNYENGLSNGTKNYLIIKFNDNKKQKIQFQKNNACEFKEIEEVIKHYYVNNKIGYLNCVDILCLSEQKEWNEFKNLDKHYS